MKYETPKTDKVISECNQRTCDVGITDLSKMHEHAQKLERDLNMALDRIRDLLMPEDGHAQREAEKFLEQFKKKNI